jgi:hypothetical protein
MNPEIGLPTDHKTEHCLVFNSGSLIRSCNRVCNESVPTDFEVTEIKSHFGTLPFTWAVDTTDNQTIAVLKHNNLHAVGSFPAMILDLRDIEPVDYGNEIAIKEITPESNERLKWIEIVSTSFNVSPSELTRLLDLFIAKLSPSALRLYVAYYNGQAAAASMALQHGQIIALHWIATIPEFRNKGLGFAVTHKPLVDSKANGDEQALLLASVMGKPVYDRIGFEQYAVYTMYAPHE